jgi:hypothetical protein
MKEATVNTTDPALSRVSEIRALFQRGERDAARRRLTTTLEELSLSRHTQSWLNAARNCMSYCHGAGERRHAASVMRCLDNALEGPGSDCAAARPAASTADGRGMPPS